MRIGRCLHRGLRTIGACLLLAGCDQPPDPITRAAALPEPSPIDGVGYIVFSAPITAKSSALLITDIDKLQAQGAREIDLAINSAGGEISAAQSIVGEMDRLHAASGVVFNAYDIHLVASAATLVFLDAQGRYAVPHSGFIFHAPFMIGSGAFSAETLRKGADQIDRDTQVFRDVLLARTHLTRQQIDVYVSRTVVLSTNDAQDDGVIDAVRTLALPKDARCWIIMAKQKSSAEPRDTSAHADPG